MDRSTHIQPFGATEIHRWGGAAIIQPKPWRRHPTGDEQLPIGRRLGDRINPSQVVQDGLEKRIAFAELVRVFGEPKGRPADMGAVRIDSPARDETPRQPSEDRTSELIAELRDRLAETKERAERYEQEAIELRRTNAALVAQFLPAATSTTPKPGFFGRWFGG